MVAGSIFWKSLRDQRLQIAGYGISLLLMAMLVVYLWPTYREALQDFELPPAFEAFLGADLSIATASGFLHAEYFSWIIILLLVYAVMQGTGAIAGEESSGTAELLLAQPVRRESLVLQKTAAAAVAVAVMAAMGFAGFALSVPFADIDVTLADTALACANLVPVTLFYYAFSLWLGAVAPGRAWAAGAAVAAITAAYFANTLAAGIEQIRWLRWTTPLHYYGGGLPLVDGINGWHVALLLGAAALLTAAATRAFVRRDAGPSPEATLRDVVARALG